MTGPLLGNSSSFLRGSSADLGEGLSIRVASRRDTFSGATLIAGILDSSSGAVGASGGRISQALASGAARNISQAIDQLNPSERNALQARWGRSLDELVSLSNERDARVFHHGLLQVGRRLEDGDQIDLAGVVYSGLVAGGERGSVVPGAEIVAGAQRRLNAMNGVGDWRERFAFSLQRIPNQATRWDVLLAMTGAGFTFRGFRLLTTASWAGSFESALALNAASASTAFLAETIAFTSLGKVAGALAGHPQDTSTEGIFNEWAGGAAMLLGLKGMGALTGAGVRSIYGEGVAATATGRLTQLLAPQAGMFMGILVGNRLAEAGGFHPERHGDTWLVDGITTLIEFNVAGRLQRAAGGPALASLEARMEALTRMMPRHSGRTDSGAEGGTRPSLLEEMASVFRPDLVTPEGIRITMSSIEGEGSSEGEAGLHNTRFPGSGGTGGIGGSSGGGSGGGRGSSGSGGESEIPVWEKQYRPETLPIRTGTGVDLEGRKVIDPVAETDLDRPYPAEILDRIAEASPEVRQDLLRQIGVSVRDIDSVTPETLDRISNADFGLAVGMLLREGINKYFSTRVGQQGFHGIDSVPVELRPLVRSLDELMGITLFSYRAGPRVAEMTEGIEYVLQGEGMAQLDILQRGLREMLAPRLGIDQVPYHRGFAAEGSGAMTSLFMLPRHRMGPGADPNNPNGPLAWYTPLVVLARDQAQVDQMNSDGVNTRHLDMARRLNFRYDPPIMAIGPLGLRVGSREISQRDIRRTFQTQMFNVKSEGLPEIMSPERLEEMPRNALIFEVMKGFIGRDRGKHYSPKENEQPTLLPYELINMGLRMVRRTDVEVVSGGGYIPDKYLLNQTPVRMHFASREGRARYSRPGADLAATVLAGPSKANSFIGITTSHYQHSTELGGALKNVVALMAGMRAVAIGRENPGRRFTPREAEDIFEAEIHRPLRDIMIDFLRLENIIDPNRPGYEEKLRFPSEVSEDARLCMGVDLNAVTAMMEEGLGGFLDLRTPAAGVDFVRERVFKRRYEFSNTRNGVAGVGLGTVREWERNGGRIRPTDIDFKSHMTAEGLDSLNPLANRNRYPDHPIEYREQPEEFVDTHDFYNWRSPAAKSPHISEEILRGLRGEVPDIDKVKLREALEGRSQRALSVLSSEIERYFDYLDVSRRDPQNAEALVRLNRQRQLLPRLVEAIKIGEVRHPRDFPFYLPPYENAILIPIRGGPGRPTQFRAYLRVEGNGVMDRLTQLGLFIKSLGPNPHFFAEAEATGLIGRDGVLQKNEIEETARRILTAFHREAPGSRLAMKINNTDILPDLRVMDDYHRERYRQNLEPIIELLRASTDDPVGADTIREPREKHASLLRDVLDKHSGWPMLLGYYGNTIHGALKSGLTRPETQTLQVLYDRGRPVGAFMVYRGPGNEPWILNHGLIRDWMKMYPEEFQRLETRSREAAAVQPGFPEIYPDNPSIHIYDGLRAVDFLPLWNRFAQDRGLPLLTVEAIKQSRAELGEEARGIRHGLRVVPLESLPIEQILVNAPRGINPASLRFFLVQRSEARDQMLDELLPYYEREWNDTTKSEVVEVIQRYLTPFVANQPELQNHPLFRIFEERGSRALQLLLFRRDHRSRSEGLSSLPPALGED